METYLFDRGPFLSLILLYSYLSGQITLATSLDREVKDKYDLFVRASDGKQQTDCLVSILVQDVNDYTPTFDRPLYTFDLPENMAVGTTIGRVHADDLDLGSSGEIIYSMVANYGSDVFELNSQQGTFTLKTFLDFEQVGNRVGTFYDLSIFTSIFRQHFTTFLEIFPTIFRGYEYRISLLYNFYEKKIKDKTF